MSQRSLIVIAWISILILSSVLRLHNLEERPVHADEATGARILSQRLSGDFYQFNPKHFHGPLLSLSSTFIAQIRSEQAWDSLSVTTLRLGPAIAGIMLIFTPLLWLRRIGHWGALAAAALLGTSPLLVYYNRMYIHESLLTLFAMLACAAIFRLIEKPSKHMGILTGLSLGLMFATKETFVISVMAWLPATFFCLWKQPAMTASQQTPLNLRDYLFPLILLLLTAITSSAYFYSDGFRSPQGMIDAVRTYFIYETTAGHEKGYNYYFQLLLWPKHPFGTWWSEALIAVLAAATVAYSVFRRSRSQAIHFLAITSLVHFAIYSTISYKTPWLMLVPWAHVCLLAGFIIHTLPSFKKPTRITLVALLLLGVTYQAQQSIQSSGRLANDNRNPYAYVPTSKDAANIEQWLSLLCASTELTVQTPIAVIGHEYWPLPWYLRNFKTVGYWPTPIETLIDYPIVFAMPAQVHASDQRFNSTHTKLPRSLRTNVSVALYLRNDIWNDWMNPADQ